MISIKYCIIHRLLKINYYYEIVEVESDCSVTAKCKVEQNREKVYFSEAIAVAEKENPLPKV